MPSVSEKQKRMMQAVAHNKRFANKVGIPQNVGREFEMADKAKETQKDKSNKRYGKDKGKK